ncbi:MAG: radical SAM family heme chaperone HemW [Bacteroidales bacterium]|nr:radical SAM family heme chaperone HemW [Bacteroidales bacterium]
MIYVHVPFCRSFCTYCDFYSERACPTEAYVDGVCREAFDRRDEIAATAAVNTLYIGGGTPSVLPLPYLARIADACGGRHYEEWTVEVNPDDITPEYARGLRELGVNRVSMGVQSLDDGMLRWMNRRHDADGARRAFRLLREAGFDNISVDVIFGVGGMSPEMLETTVRELLEWRPEHISAYQLSVEEGSALGRMAREGRYTELPDEACSEQYYLICRLLAAAGYEHYEISNWALPGHRAIHNSAYWTRKPYVGLGPGAHSLRVSVPPGIPLQRSSLRSSLPLRSACGPLPLTCPRVDTDPEAGRPDSADTFAASGGPSPTRGGSGGTPPVPLGAAALAAGVDSSSSCDVRSWNSEELSGWTATSEELTEEEIREERIMLGLRTAEGLPEYGRIPEEKWFVADDIISSLI